MVSKAFTMNDRWTRLVVLLFTDPHLLKRGQRGQYRAADPHRILSLWRRNYLYFHGVWRQCCYLFLHAIRNTRVHGGAAGQDRVGVQIFSDVNVTFHD